MINQGDLVGFMNEEDQGPVAHSFVDSGVRVLFASLVEDNSTQEMPLPVPGDVVDFDSLALPYIFAASAVVDYSKWLNSWSLDRRLQ